MASVTGQPHADQVTVPDDAAPPTAVATSTTTSSKTIWLALGGVVLVFVIVTSIVAVKTPAWEANDEPGHVQNVESLVSGHWYSIPPPLRSEAKNSLLVQLRRFRTSTSAALLLALGGVAENDRSSNPSAVPWLFESGPLFRCT